MAPTNSLRERRTMPSIPLACWICGNSTNLNNCKTDEHDLPVHEQCYVEYIELRSNLPVGIQLLSAMDSLVVLNGWTSVQLATFRTRIAQSDVKKTQEMIRRTSWAIRRSKKLI